MNTRILAISAGLAALAAAAAPATAADLVLPRVSPKTTVSQSIGLTDFTVSYSRPGVKGRVIWGELVPYDKPWRTGANEATSFTTNDDVIVEGQKLAAGTYSFFTIPGKEQWTVVFNKEKDLWGAFAYKPEQDVLRVTVKPQPAEHQEWMRIDFENLTPSSGDLVVRWEKLAIPVKVQVNVMDKAMANIRTALAEAKADDWRTPYRAAGFLLEADAHPELMMEWANKSLKIDENYSNLSLMARIHAKSGKKKEAIGYAEKAIKAGKASKETVDTSATEKLLAEWKKG
jgi:DUF2911 family protein